MIDPNICFGKPYMHGHRVWVSFLTCWQGRETIGADWLIKRLFWAARSRCYKIKTRLHGFEESAQANFVSLAAVAQAAAKCL